MQKFVGGGLQLRSTDAVYSGVGRDKLNTVAMGSVHFNIGIILRNFDKYGVQV